MIGETCIAAPAAFNFGAFLTKKDVVDYVSPGSSSSESGEAKKRRRGDLANPANTLDGLVARRADDSREPFQKRFLSEQEAIEGPDDEQEMKKMENDPDVSTRTCSTCGYQGKWVSEMIRHKRVHTADRPFKCRYCTRTSKWKADLIRHVAKTHGIRVVSKYSRSKTFDPATTLLSNRSEEDKPRAYACEMAEMNSSPALFRPEPVSPIRRPLYYRCVQCLFEQDGLSLMVNHLKTVHSCSPYECRCGESFEDIETAMGHARKVNGCSSSDLVVNITPLYNRKAPSVSSFSSISPSGSCTDSSPDNLLTNTETEEEDGRKCSLCPYKSIDSRDFSTHLKGHSSALHYKCYFCSWSTADRSEVEVHMRLHCQYPSQFMPPVEKNLLPSDGLLSLLPSPLDLTAAFLLLQQRMTSQFANPLVSPLALMSLTSSAFTPISKINNCDRCEARFHDASALSLHRTKHGANSLFTCPICDYSSGRATNLILHIQNHHNGGLVESAAEEQEDEVVDVETD